MMFYEIIVKMHPRLYKTSIPKIYSFEFLQEYCLQCAQFLSECYAVFCFGGYFLSQLKSKLVHVCDNNLLSRIRYKAEIRFSHIASEYSVLRLFVICHTYINLLSKFLNLRKKKSITITIMFLKNYVFLYFCTTMKFILQSHKKIFETKFERDLISSLLHTQ